MSNVSSPGFIRHHHEWEVYRMAFDAAMKIFELSRKFPRDERYSLTDQIRRSSRAVSANLAEAWRRRRYRGSFLLRLNDAEAEAAETQTWLHFAVKCDYLTPESARDIFAQYDKVIGTIVNITRKPDSWLLTHPKTPSPKNPKDRR